MYVLDEHIYTESPGLWIFIWIQLDTLLISHLLYRQSLSMEADKTKGLSIRMQFEKILSSAAVVQII